MKMEFSNWAEANQRYLMAALGEVRFALRAHAAPSENSDPPSDDFNRIAGAMPAPPAIEALCRVFSLSPFERAILLLCAGVELDGSMASLCASAQRDDRRPFPTFGLALAAFPDPHWSALSPVRPLRRWRLIETLPADTLTAAPLRIDERILHYLAGASHCDERLAGMIEPLDLPCDDLPAGHRALAARLAGAWTGSADAKRRPFPLIQLCGSDAAGRRAVAAAICEEAGARLYTAAIQFLPSAAVDLELIIRLWQREAVIAGCVLLVDLDESDDPVKLPAVMRLIERVDGPIIVASWERLRPTPQRRTVTAEVPSLSTSQQRTLWEAVLGSQLNGNLDAVVSQFSLSAPAIRSAGAAALTRSLGQAPPAAPTEEHLGALLWEECRMQARPRLAELAQRIEPAAAWDDLVLPDAQRQTLRDIAAHVRQRTKVYETWGFGGQGSRGLGISALFAGVSGTGKTMAAEVLANELRLDLYRIDLSSVVSKYIGETEKNLRRVFDAAEEGGAILLFDEADALFGKRSEVKDSHDRYANIEVSYLLQRMEAYRGLAILTTNMKGALDTAFLRRIRFTVEFPFPGAVERTEIWRRVFPRAAPTDGVDAIRLAALHVTGGNIRNIALNAAFLAADAGEPIRMRHLLRAARGECAKLERPVSEMEVAGWA